MGFADAYLLKAGLRESSIQTDPHSDLKIIVAIPVTNESGLLSSLDSLFKAAEFAEQPTFAEQPAFAEQPTFAEQPVSAEQPTFAEQPASAKQLGGTRSPFRSEVLLLVNAAANAPSAILEQNLLTLAQAQSWIASHPHPHMDFHIWMDHTFGKKEAGVGMARKLLMDEAARRFNTIGNAGGIIACMDADATVDPNYIQALVSHFYSGYEDEPSPDFQIDPNCPDGCSIYFEHPLEGDLFPPGVYDAITQYELHLRYYLEAMRSTGHPHAYHTVGSSFAVRADIYCLEGGMNRRKGGEDFYFIQKVAQRGNWSECFTTRVNPSPRPSDRVPFGTGRAVQELMHDADPSGNIPTLSTYHPEPFGMLQQLFSRIDGLYLGSHDFALGELPAVLSEFLAQQGFEEALDEIRSNTGSAEAFRKRFWRWFNMFRIMKFLHYARDKGYPAVPVGSGAKSLLSLENQLSYRELLEIFRKKQQS